MAAFRVVIIGGCVTGLTLANALERYGIEYTLLEKHDSVNSPIGASIGLLPHALRILSQLGFYECLRPYGATAEDFNLHGPDGKYIGGHSNLGRYMEAMLGYKILFLERERLIQALYNGIADKSNLHFSSRVVKIEHANDGVHVETEDGRIFKGSIVVGADGVHSKAREEMWRLAAKDNCDIGASRDRKAIGSTFSCIFGISKNLNRVKPTHTWKHVRQDRHYLFQGAPGKVFWFVFFKNQKRVNPGEVLRYTADEKHQYAVQFLDDQVREDLTFREVYENQTSLSLVPVEEYNLKRHFYKRLILLGDAVHKLHPITAQGGSAAIEDAVSLANRLKDVTRTGKVPSDSQLQAIFTELQNTRGPRIEMLGAGAHGLARLETFANRFLKLMMYKFIRKIPREDILASLAVSMGAGEALKYVPLPQESTKGLVPYDDELRIVPRDRSKRSTGIWISLVLLVGVLQFFSPTKNWSFSLVPPTPAASASSALQICMASSYLAMSAFWCMESQRVGFALKPIHSSIPFVLLALLTRWELALTIYLSLWIYGSRPRGFYHPSPRAIPLPAAKALPAALTTVLAAVGVSVYTGYATIAADGPNGWSLGLASLPVLTTLITHANTRRFGPQWGPEYQWGNMDMPYIYRFFDTVAVITSAAHASFMLQVVIPALRHGYFTIRGTDEVIRYGTFSALITLFLVFTIWDLRRVKIVDLTWGHTLLYISVGMVVFGPGGSLPGAWRWREGVLERARQRPTSVKAGKTD